MIGIGIKSKLNVDNININIKKGGKMAKKGIWILVSLVVIVGLLVGVFGCTAPTATTTTTTTTTTPTATAEPINLVYHFSLIAGTNVAISWWWMDEVERLTDGRVTFERISGGTLGSTEQQPDNLRAGVFDLGEISCVYNPAQYPYTGVSVLPFLTSSMEAMNYAQYDWLQTPEVQAEHRALNTIGLMSWVLEPMEVLSHEPATTLEELKVLKTRAHGGGADALAAVDGVPVAIPWEELASSAERHVIDAAIVPVPITSRDNGFQDIFEYALRVPIYYFQWGLSMNLDTWNSLPADIQQIMLDIAKDSAEKNNEIFNEAMTGAWEDFAAAGVEQVTWSQAELDKFEQGGGPPSWEKWINDTNALGLNGQKIFDDFKEIVGKYGG